MRGVPLGALEATSVGEERVTRTAKGGELRPCGATVVPVTQGRTTECEADVAVSILLLIFFGPQFHVFKVIQEN
jgi:hypothetical protein